MSHAGALRILSGRVSLKGDPRGPLELVKLGERGVTKSALTRLAKFLAMSPAEMAKLLPVTDRTIQRYRGQQTFNRVVSEQILEIAAVAARGAEVFGDRARFLAWMERANVALGGRTPRELLASRFGIDLVLDELGRIEHGIVS